MMMQSFVFWFCMSMFFCTDYSHGFGGKYGVQKDRQDKSALGWDEQQALAKHESQKGGNSVM